MIPRASGVGSAERKESSVSHSLLYPFSTHPLCDNNLFTSISVGYYVTRENIAPYLLGLQIHSHFNIENTHKKQKCQAMFNQRRESKLCLRCRWRLGCKLKHVYRGRCAFVVDHSTYSTPVRCAHIVICCCCITAVACNCRRHGIVAKTVHPDGHTRGCVWRVLI